MRQTRSLESSGLLTSPDCTHHPLPVIRLSFFCLANPYFLSIGPSSNTTSCGKSSQTPTCCPFPDSSCSSRYWAETLYPCPRLQLLERAQKPRVCISESQGPAQRRGPRSSASAHELSQVACWLKGRVRPQTLYRVHTMARAVPST